MANEQCVKCNKPLNPGDRFCAACGNPVVAGKQQATPPQPSGMNWKRDGTILAVLVIVVAVAFVMMRDKPEPPVQAVAPPGHEGMEGGMLEGLPTEFDPLVQMGNEFMDQKNYPLAAELYRRALEIDSSAHDVRTDFGSCLNGMGLPDRAIEEFYRVITEHPEHGIANFNLGIVYFSKGNNDSARYYWEKYLDGDPEGRPEELAREYLQQIGN